jgi:hypothetical protein
VVCCIERRCCPLGILRRARSKPGRFNVTDKTVDTVTNNGVLNGRRYVVALNDRV